MDRGLSRLHILLILILVGVLGLGGAYTIGVLGAPSVENVENRFVGVNETTTLIDTDIVVHNPNPIGVQLGGITVNYTVDLNHVRMARGTKSGINITRGNTTLGLRTAMNNEQIPTWWTSHIRNGEQSALKVHATVTSSLLGRNTSFAPIDRPVETDILSAFNSEETRPVNANHELISDPILYINETSAVWGTVSDRETPIDMEFTAYNPKSVPYTITEIGYTITMNNLTVGEGQSDRAYVLPPRQTETVVTMTAIQNDQLDEWWASHLERNQITDLRIDFYARIELETGQAVRVPLDALTYTETIDTDIFGTKNESVTHNDSETTPTPGEQQTTTAGDAEQTSTRTATPTETPTDTPTETESDDDDGLLLTI